MGWFSRYRHSRGFGIHSPFAFRFVTECLCERLPYYDYEGLPEPSARLLYRVACHLRPAAIAVEGGADASSAMMACPQARPVATDRADMVVVADSADVDMEALRRAIGREAVIFVQGRHKALMPRLLAMIDDHGRGMTFNNCRDAAVLVPRRKLPRQDFDVRF